VELKMNKKLRGVVVAYVKQLRGAIVTTNDE
jgi:hypothetical protein